MGLVVVVKPWVGVVSTGLVVGCGFNADSCLMLVRGIFSDHPSLQVLRAETLVERFTARMHVFRKSDVDGGLRPRKSRNSLAGAISMPVGAGAAAAPD